MEENLTSHILSFQSREGEWFQVCRIQPEDYWNICNMIVANEDRLQTFFPSTKAANLTPDLSKRFAQVKSKQFDENEEYLFVLKPVDSRRIIGLIYIKELDWSSNTTPPVIKLCVAVLNAMCQYEHILENSASLTPIHLRKILIRCAFQGNLPGLSTDSLKVLQDSLHTPPPTSIQASDRIAIAFDPTLSHPISCPWGLMNSLNCCGQSHVGTHPDENL